MKQPSTASTSAYTHHDEHILVLKRKALFPTEAWSGLRAVDFAQYQTLIEQHKEFLPRSLMETDPTYKQIIPYLVYEYNNRYFLMQRKSTSTEQRLQNKYSLGIGGHIRQEDMVGASLSDWARREFHEEVYFDGSFTIEPLGILNDDSNSVGQVHVGFIFILQGNSPHITIKSELKSGVLLSLNQLRDFYPHMENWSHIVFDYLVQHKGE